MREQVAYAVEAYADLTVWKVCSRVAKIFVFACAIALPLPVGAFSLYSWLGGAWLCLPIFGSIIVAIVGIGIANLPADLDAHEEAEVRLAVYALQLGVLLLPVVGYLVRRSYGSAWAIATAAATPALILAVPQVFLLANRIRAAVKWRRLGRRTIRNRTRGSKKSEPR
jgi:hypothetical protein